MSGGRHTVLFCVYTMGFELRPSAVGGYKAEGVKRPANSPHHEPRATAVPLIVRDPSRIKRTKCGQDQTPLGDVEGGWEEHCMRPGKGGGLRSHCS